MKTWFNEHKKLAVSIFVGTVAIILALILFLAVFSGERPPNVAEILNLGEKYLLELDYEQALVQFLSVIEIEPMNARAYIGAAEAYIGQGDTESAIAILEKGLSAIPGNVNIQAKLDEILLSISKPEPTSTPTSTPTPMPTPKPTPTPIPEFEQPPIGLDIGQTAPNFTLSLRGGGSVTLWELRGKPTLINVCATWCPPCQHEFPEIQRLYDEYASLVNVIGISTWETKAEADEYFDRFDYQYMIAYASDDQLDSVYSLEFVPQTWILDLNGVIVGYIAGSATFDEFAVFIDEALHR